MQMALSSLAIKSMIHKKALVQGISALIKLGSASASPIITARTAINAIVCGHLGRNGLYVPRHVIMEALQKVLDHIKLFRWEREDHASDQMKKASLVSLVAVADSFTVRTQKNAYLKVTDAITDVISAGITKMNCLVANHVLLATHPLMQMVVVVCFFLIAIT